MTAPQRPAANSDARKRAEERAAENDAPGPAEEFEALRRLGPKLSRSQWSRMQELERILDALDARVIPPGSSAS